MKISELSAMNNLVKTQTGVEQKHDGPKGFVFKNELSSLNQKNCAEALEAMHAGIAKQGETVARRCDILEFKRYREMVAEFMGEAVRFVFQFKKQSTLDARGRHRIYAIIKRVNEKLERLAREMLAGQADQLAVMETMDEIRGMLMDLYL